MSSLPTPDTAQALLAQAGVASEHVRRMANRRANVLFVWAGFVLVALALWPLLPRIAGWVSSDPTLPVLVSAVWSGAILVGAYLVLTWQRIYLRRGEERARGATDPMLPTLGLTVITGIPMNLEAAAGVGLYAAAYLLSQATAGAVWEGFPVAAVVIALALVRRGLRAREGR